jgi:hypothetical protein
MESLLTTGGLVVGILIASTHVVSVPIIGRLMAGVLVMTIPIIGRLMASMLVMRIAGWWGGIQAVVVRNNGSATPHAGGYADHPHGVQDKVPLDNKAPSSDNSQA